MPTRDNASRHILSLDVGTTGVKAFVFDEHEKPISRGYAPLRKSSPKNGWVEQDPREILSVSEELLRNAVANSGIGADEIGGFALANQRETTIIWERASGDPVYPAIVWEDARTADFCDTLSRKHGEQVREKTGLPIDSYFSASKIRWILDEVPGARKRAENGELCFGTVDSWILWNFAEGHPHTTDYTNASRTLLFNIKTKVWDDELLSLFDVPRALLPSVGPSASAHFGVLSNTVCGATIPIRAVAGDQQASLFAAGSAVGTTKITFGTGIFMMHIIGNEFRVLPSFFTTLSAGKGEPRYALEAKVGDCAVRVSPLIGKKELTPLLDEFAREVAGFIAKLPFPPKELTIDGGVTQAPHLRVALERETGLLIREHALFDGTALGITRLAFSGSEV